VTSGARHRPSIHCVGSSLSRRSPWRFRKDDDARRAWRSLRVPRRWALSPTTGAPTSPAHSSRSRSSVEPLPHVVRVTVKAALFGLELPQDLPAPLDSIRRSDQRDQQAEQKSCSLDHLAILPASYLSKRTCRARRSSIILWNVALGSQV